MKPTRKLITGLLGIAALTLALAAGAAAQCALVVVGKDAQGTASCSFTGEDANWCYYDCTCTGNCDNVYTQLGLIDA
jgi:hypothetical protein